MMPPEPSSARRIRPKAKFPWLALILLIASLYVFWVLPHQVPDGPIEVEFSAGESD